MGTEFVLILSLFLAWHPPLPPKALQRVTSWLPPGRQRDGSLAGQSRRGSEGLSRTAHLGRSPCGEGACSGATRFWSLPVCEPQGSRPPSRRRNVSIDERWRPAVLGGGERPGLAGATLSYRDLAQIVAQLVSEDVDKDVLFPHPPRSAESGSAFQGFLVRSAPFWRNVTLEAQAPRSPPS
uniref:Uncharacterized protein n=1 Tax=Balaenoptera musculus TaxID=9771 RepID=A0A8C0D5D4_BALMU